MLLAGKYSKSSLLQMESEGSAMICKNRILLLPLLLGPIAWSCSSASSCPTPDCEEGYRIELSERGWYYPLFDAEINVYDLGPATGGRCTLEKNEQEQSCGTGVTFRYVWNESLEGNMLVLRFAELPKMVSINFRRGHLQRSANITPSCCTDRFNF